MSGRDGQTSKLLHIHTYEQYEAHAQMLLCPYLNFGDYSSQRLSVSSMGKLVGKMAASESPENLVKVSQQTGQEKEEVKKKKKKEEETTGLSAVKWSCETTRYVYHSAGTGCPEIMMSGLQGTNGSPQKLLDTRASI